MKPKAFLILAVLTAVSVVAAGYAVIAEQRRLGAMEAYGNLMFPDLAGRANEVSRITVKDADETMTVVRRGGTWVLTSRDDYPVPVEKVRKVVASIAALRLLEPKTDRPERYHRLNLQDVDKEDAKSKLVTLADGAGKTFTRLLIGRRNLTRVGIGTGGVYVRKPDETRTWLAEGSVDLPAQAVNWLERTVIDLPSDRVKRMTFREAGETLFTVERSDKDQKDLTLSPVPAGRTVDDVAVSGLASALASLRFDDVRADSDVRLQSLRVTEVESFEGLIVRTEIGKIDDKTWARFSASGAGEVADQAKSINETAEGWLYKIPDYKASNLIPRLDDLLKPEKDTS